MVFQRLKICNTRIWRPRRTPPLIVALLLLFPVLGGCAMAGRQTVLEQFLDAPASAERHHQLAELYERNAANARAQAGHHLSIAASYRNKAASASGPEAEIHHSIVLHCEALMRDFENEAARYEGMAANHRALAETERRGSPWERREDRQETGY